MNKKQLIIIISVNLIIGILIWIGSYDMNFEILKQSWGSNPPMPLDIGTIVSTTTFTLMILCFTNGILLLIAGNKLFNNK